MKLKLKNLCNDIVFLWQFSLDDFKSKYAGSAAGAAWAILQPLSTIILYWFVFQIGFKSQPVTSVPFVLWLVAGLLPWLFFSEAIANATSALADYSYLVKKIKFNLYILPLVKIVSGLFVHAVLVGFVICMFAGYGILPDLYYLQLPFYALFMIIVLAGICFFTATLFVFFKDVIQVVSILLQVIFWTTPIVWSIDIMDTTVQKVITHTPFYYFVNGYRDIFVNKVWFWSYGISNVYYWGVALLILAVGLITFVKFKNHFADVL